MLKNKNTIFSLWANTTDDDDIEIMPENRTPVSIATDVLKIKINERLFVELSLERKGLHISVWPLIKGQTWDDPIEYELTNAELKEATSDRRG